MLNTMENSFVWFATVSIIFILKCLISKEFQLGFSDIYYGVTLYYACIYILLVFVYREYKNSFCVGLRTKQYILY